MQFFDCMKTCKLLLQSKKNVMKLRYWQKLRLFVFFLQQLVIDAVDQCLI